MPTPLAIRRFEAPARRGLRRRLRTLKKDWVVAIGDIHGRYDLLTALIRELDARFDHWGEGSGHLVVLGDMIDRGPDSRHVVNFLKRLTEEVTRATVLLGNHEAVLLDVIAGDATAQRLWLRHGGEATLASYDIAPPRDGEDSIAFGMRLADQIGADTIEWLRDRPLSVRHGDYFFCHAGIRPGISLSRQADDDLLWISDAFLDDERDHGAVVVHGHSIVDDPEVRINRIGVDTGAYRTGRLTAAVLSDSEGWTATTDPLTFERRLPHGDRLHVTAGPH